MKRLTWLCAAAILVASASCKRRQIPERNLAEEGAEQSGPAGDRRGGDEGGGSAPDDASSGDRSTWDGHQRLGDDVTPEAYDLSFRIDPSQETFEGDVRIDADLEEPVRRVRMHAEGLDFSEVRASRDGESRSLEYESVENGGLVLRFERALEPGPLELSFEYEAPLDEIPEGLYRVRDAGSWYAFTQLQPLEAREMYPAFDEPKFKTPFSVSVTVPEGMMAVGNAPEVRRTEVEDEEMVEFQFAETEPLPTYLVAVAVGDFDVVEASDVVEEDERLADLPVRVLTTEGQGGLAEYALRKTPGLVRFQEEYFGLEFPYEKMDLVAVPNFAAGAMENVGLVTFRESLLLVDEESASLEDEYWAQAIMAHEYAHMWFGNLVTLEWWDELWLNEAFATWMGGRTVQEVSPELEPEVQSIRRRSGVIRADSLKNSRAIRQPIEDGGDVYNAFDNITYNKGAAVLRMFENWMGGEEFREGVRSFLADHLHGTARTEDLLASFSRASGEDVERTIAGFLDQPGAPLVTVGYDRTSCREGGASLELEQTRYLPVGSRAETGEPWRIPMCVRYGDGDGATGEECFVFEGSEGDRRSQTVDLETESCPRWIHPNASEKGYYHWKLEPRSLQTELLERRSALELPERVALLGHLEALMRSGSLAPGVYLDSMVRISGESHRAIVRQIIDSLGMLEEVVYRGEPSSTFREYARSLLGAHYDKIGFAPKPSDSPGERLLRSDLVKAMARFGADGDIRARSVEFTEKFLADSGSVSGRVAKYAVDIAARPGDAELWERIRRAAQDPPSPDLRAELLGALGRFESPGLARKSMELFLSDEVRSQHFWTLVGPVSGDPQTVDLAWEWMTENYGAIVDKIGEAQAGRLPFVGSAYCSEAKLGRVKSFFSAEERRTVGTERNLAKTLQSIRQCAELRSLIGDGVRQGLRK